MSRNDDDRAPLHPMLQHPGPLTSKFRYAVSVRRSNGLLLVHGQALDAAVELPCRCVHDHRIRRGFPRRLDQPDLRHRVHRDIGERIALSTHVAGLRREVKDNRRALAQRTQVDLTDIAADQFDLRTLQIRGLAPPPNKKPSSAITFAPRAASA